MSGIGPVEEPAPGAGDEPTLRPTVLSTSEVPAWERRLGDWWRSLSHRRRRALPLGAAGLLGALALLAVLVTPGTRQGGSAGPAPEPWPAQITRVVYSGIGTSSDPTGHRFTVLATFSDTSSTAVTVTQITQPYRGVALTVTRPPGLPFTLRPGRPLVVPLAVDIRDCRYTPVGDRLPFLDVTMSNTRAIQQQSEILGDAYARDLSRLITAACREDGTVSASPAAAAPTLPH
ncbi:hypothetical protein [Streptacidiphilus sp. EB129]|uniref:hypothetical protein n=1 Tax=Streptacidiphilus sp. EB129 TaxID=3156262 RepID=UPI003512C970